jgi:hypothetical protein
MTTRTWSDVRGAKATVPAHVVFRAFAQETVLLNIRTGQYYGVDPIGGRFLEAIQAGPDLATASETLASEYGQPLDRIQADLTAFVDALAQRGLVELGAA